MTIIAHFSAFGLSSLVGDLLVSSDTDPARAVHIPASRRINERIFLPPNYFIVGMRQKLILLNDKVAVAWAGNYNQAENLIVSLEPLRGLPETDIEYIRSAIESVDGSLKDDLSLIVLVCSAACPQIITHRTASIADFGPIAQIICGGSGRGACLEIIRQCASNVIAANPGASEEDLRESFAPTIVGALAGEEFSSTLTLQRGWDGGFEAISCRVGHLQRIRGQLSLNFVLEQEANGWSLRFVPNLRHVDYWNGATIVQAIEHEVEANGRILPGRRDVFMVTAPGSASPDLSTFVPPDIQSHEMALSYVLHPSTQDVITYSAAYTQPVMHYDAPQGSASVSFSFDSMFIEDLITGCAARLNAPISFRGAVGRPA